MHRILVAVVLAVALLVARAATVGADQTHEEPGKSFTYQVKPGQTLWSIARDVYPDEDPRDGIRRIQDANDLRGGLIRAGMQIVVPTR